MQYDAGFLLYQLRYSADYEDWATVENATSWSHKANNSPFCNAVQLQWEKTFNSAEWETLKNRRKVGIFYSMGVPRYPPFLTYPNFQFLHLNPTYLSQTAFGIDFLVDKCCGLST